MRNWSEVRVFGARSESSVWVVRESAYVLAIRSDGCLAVVRTDQGTFLPGGGIESGETPQDAIVREALEECRLVIQPGAWAVRAIQLVYSESEQTHFEKRSVFLDGLIVGFDSMRCEAGHSLIWVTLDEATRILSHESQRWAVEQWRIEPQSECERT